MKTIPANDIMLKSRKPDENGFDNISLSSSEDSADERHKIKYGTRAEACWGIFSEYCSHTSIHGIQYFAESKRSLFEKIFWICMFVLSGCGCSILILNVWEKWQNMPVIVSFNEETTPVWKIPFPAVTICPERKFSQEVFNYTDVILSINSTSRTITDEEKSYLDAAAQICEYETLEYIINDKINFPDKNKFTNFKTIIDALQELDPSAEEPLEYTWQSTEENSNFRQILTEEGICQTFNLIDPKYMYREEAIHSEFFYDDTNNNNRKDVNLDWSLEDGYKPNAPIYTYPRRALGSGAKSGLLVWLPSIKLFYDFLCRGPIQGHKMILHSPDELGDVSGQFIQVPLGQQIMVSIKPNIITTNDNLIKYSPEARQCFFQKERYLRFFKFYTQKNCEMECFTNFTLQECNCVRFDMPRNIDTPVCGLGSMKCYNVAEQNLLKKRFEMDASLGCNCMPACTTVVYETEVTQSAYSIRGHMDLLLKGIPEEVRALIEITRLFVFFKETQFLTSKRSELYGTTDFLANCGGLLGLFMGFSILSLVEIIYFLTFRLTANVKLRKSKNKNNRRV